MAARVDSLLMTVEQSRRLPDDVTEFFELQRGELVAVTQPKMRHTRIQRRLLDLLDSLTREQGVVMVEMPCRPLREYDSEEPMLPSFLKPAGIEQSKRMTCLDHPNL